MNKSSRVPLLRTSERGAFLDCQWYWDVTYRQGWTSKRQPTWSWFGTAFHKAMEARYPVGRKRGSLRAMYDAFEDALDGEQRRMYVENVEFEETEIVQARDLGRAMLRGYVEKWGKDVPWEVIHTEQSFQIDVVDDSGRLVAIYCGTWDLLVWDRVEKIFKLVDHKTAARFDGFGWLVLNKQAGSYLWVAPEVLRSLGIFKKSDTIDSIIFNYAKKSMPDDRPRNDAGEALNKDGTVSKRQPAELFHREETYRRPEERVRQYRRVLAEAEQMRLIRGGKVTPTKHDSAQCMRCPLFDVCEVHEYGGDWEDVLRAGFVKRDPYRDHREAVKEGKVHIITTLEDKK